MPTITIYQGCALDVLPTLDPESFQSCVTSPPYFGLRDYGIPPRIWPTYEYQPMPGLPTVVVPEMTCCLGLEPTPEAYVGHMVAIMREVRRVLRADGVCWFNVGDSYASSGQPCPQRDCSGGFTGRDHGTRGKQGYANASAGPVRNMPETLKPKDLIGIPWRLAFALQADGWYLRSDVIWDRVNPMPESVTDRPTKAHEYVFMLTKSARYRVDMGAVREVGSAIGGHPSGQKNDASRNDASTCGSIRGDGQTRNIRTVWSLPSTPFSARDVGVNDSDHYAVMSRHLAERCIKIGGGPVLDPFGGAGTTGLMAARLGHDCTLIEPKASNVEIIRRRIEQDAPMFNNITVG